MFLDKLHPLAFFLSFAFGLFLCYITKPTPQLVVKFPSPYNAEKVLYKDGNDDCFKIKAEAVECPLDKTLIKPQPIAEGFQG